MIELPDFTKSYDYENYFYFTCDNQRIGKLIAHYELFKLSQNVKGDIVECGVFKGASFLKFAMYRNLFYKTSGKKLIGFDTFAEFPHTNFEPDVKMRDEFIEESGKYGISTDQLKNILKRKGCDEKVELVEGDITITIPEYVKNNPELEISLLNLDVDIYEPSVTILEHLYPRIKHGGVLIIDDYGVFAGETKAVDDYFKGTPINIKKYPFSMTPSYLIKQ